LKKRSVSGRKAREDFLSAETLALIEAAATRSEDLNWATEGQKRLKNQRSSYGNRSHKSPGSRAVTSGTGSTPRGKGKGKGKKGKATDKGKRNAATEAAHLHSEDPS
jgi:hypothetical protein